LIDFGREKIKISEMQTFMDDFGIEADISAADINSDGKINIDEFITAVLAPWLWKTDYRADKIFADIDVNSDNQIDVNEFAELARDSESKEDETVTLFKKIDTDHSGGISRSEFRTWIHQEE
jgi:calcium-dependent protein kinase